MDYPKVFCTSALQSILPIRELSRQAVLEHSGALALRSSVSRVGESLV